MRRFFNWRRENEKISNILAKSDDLKTQLSSIQEQVTEDNEISKYISSINTNIDKAMQIHKEALELFDQGEIDKAKEKLNEIKTLLKEVKDYLKSLKSIKPWSTPRMK